MQPMPLTKRSAYDVLLVEDDPGDAGLAREALREGKFTCRIHHADGGDAALDFMRRRGAYVEAPRPDLVLLDLNMPGITGWDVLQEMRGDPLLTHLPVVVLTTSDYPADVNRAYSLGANSFVTKPVDFDDFVAAMRGIEEFWFGLAKLPR